MTCISTEYGVLCSETTLVAVEKLKEKVEGEAKPVVIPIAIAKEPQQSQNYLDSNLYSRQIYTYSSNKSIPRRSQMYSPVYMRASKRSSKLDIDSSPPKNSGIDLSSELLAIQDQALELDYQQEMLAPIKSAAITSKQKKKGEGFMSKLKNFFGGGSKKKKDKKKK